MIGGDRRCYHRPDGGVSGCEKWWFVSPPPEVVITIWRYHNDINDINTGSRQIRIARHGQSGFEFGLPSAYLPESLNARASLLSAMVVARRLNARASVLSGMVVAR